MADVLLFAFSLSLMFLLTNMSMNFSVVSQINNRPRRKRLRSLLQRGHINPSGCCVITLTITHDRYD